MTIRIRSRVLALTAACVALFIAGCYGDDVTPQNTAIAGKWKVACMSVNEDCSDFAIGFDDQGDVTDFDLDGYMGPQRGMGKIVDATPN